MSAGITTVAMISAKSGDTIDAAKAGWVKLAILSFLSIDGHGECCVDVAGKVCDSLELKMLGMPSDSESEWKLGERSGTTCLPIDTNSVLKTPDLSVTICTLERSG